MKETERMSQDELKKMRRMSYIKMVAIVGFVVAVMAFGSIAWFTMSREVEGSDIGMQSGSNGIELAVNGASDRSTNSFYNLYTKLSNSFRHITGLQTNSGTNGDTIYWSLEDSDQELKPGAQGELHFTVVQGSPTSFELTVHGIHATTQQTTDPITKELVFENNLPVMEVLSLDEINASAGTTIQNQGAAYLKHHILFFKNRTGSSKQTYQYSGFINDITEFTLLPDENSQNAYTIYWIWPNTFGQIALSDSEVDQTYTGNALPVLNASPEQNDHANLITYMSTHSTSFFYPIDDANFIELLETLDEKHTAANTPAEDGEDPVTPATNNDFSEEYDTISEGYNTADQIIGSNVDYALIELIANGQ